MRLSLCIATYNEEANIHYPLDSAYDLVDEVVIVDGGSTDKTIEIAKSYGKKVRIFIEDNPSMFHINKQKAIERARGEWILQLDADEALKDELKKEIIEIVHRNYQLPITNYQKKSKFQNPNYLEEIRNLATTVAFYIPRKNFFLTRFLLKGGQYPDYTIRLYRNGYARFPCKSVHENVEIVNPKSQDTRNKQIPNNKSQITKGLRFDDLKFENYLDTWKLGVGYLQSPILHYADPTFSRYLKRWDRYTSLEAEVLSKTMKQWNNGAINQILMFMDYFFIKPFFTFFSMYFRHLGFLDGFPGFVFALFSSIRFWVIYVKCRKSVSINNNHLKDGRIQYGIE